MSASVQCMLCALGNSCCGAGSQTSGLSNSTVALVLSLATPFFCTYASLEMSVSPLALAISWVCLTICVVCLPICVIPLQQEQDSGEHSPHARWRSYHVDAPDIHVQALGSLGLCFCDVCSCVKC